MNIHIEDDTECIDVNDGKITIINKELLAKNLIQELMRSNQINGDDFDLALDNFWLTIRAEVIDLMWNYVEKNNIKVIGGRFL